MLSGVSESVVIWWGYPPIILYVYVEVFSVQDEEATVPKTMTTHCPTARFGDR